MRYFQTIDDSNCFFQGERRSIGLIALLWCCVAIGGLPQVAAVEVVPRFTVATPGDLLTFSLANAPEAWVVTDASQVPQLKITAPDGAVMFRQAYRTRAGLQVRHVARAVGVHLWKVLDAGGNAVGGPAANGQFTVVAGTNPVGPIGINPRNRRFLAWADGTPFVPVGPNVAWVDGDPVVGFTRAFATVRENGGNHVRVWMSTWCLGIEGEKNGEYQLDRADQLDAVLIAARAAGIRVTLVIDNHHDVLFGKPFPYGADPPARQNTFFTIPPAPAWAQRLRYCLARWSADDTLLAIELMNEADLALPVRERVIPWVTAASEMLKRYDLDHRLHTVSWCGGDWPRALASPAIDVVQLHQYVLEWIAETDEVKRPTRDGVEMLIPFATLANADGRPWIFGEVGFQGTNADNPGNERDTQGLLLRQQLWAGFLLGGCGGSMNWWWDVYLDAHHLWPIYRSFASITAQLDLKDPDLVPLTPNATGPVRVIGWASPRQALLWPQVRDDTWYAALVEGRPRRGLSMAQLIRLGGFTPGRGYGLTPASQLTGELGAVQQLIADEGGRLALSLPPNTVDVVWLVALTPEKK